MVRKKKKRDAEQPPFCYYCDRVFSDESTLIQHQKAKHFKVSSRYYVSLLSHDQFLPPWSTMNASAADVYLQHAPDIASNNAFQ